MLAFFLRGLKYLPILKIEYIFHGMLKSFGGLNEYKVEMKHRKCCKKTYHEKKDTSVHKYSVYKCLISLKKTFKDRVAK